MIESLKRKIEKEREASEKLCEEDGEDEEENDELKSKIEKEMDSSEKLNGEDDDELKRKKLSGEAEEEGKEGNKVKRAKC